MATVEVISSAPASTALPASHASKSGRYVVMPLYGASPQFWARMSMVSAWCPVMIMVDRRVTQRWTGASSHHCGRTSSRTRA